MRVSHINVTATLSTGRIAVEISQVLIDNGHKALLAFGRGYAPTDIPWLRIGNRVGVMMHGLAARFTDRAGFYSKASTQKLVRQLKAYRPDVVHLHNLHGYYLHMPTLFHYLTEADIPVVWTLHDSWPYTGHCAYYTTASGNASRNDGRTHRIRTTRGCDRWKHGCGNCPQKHAYPQSLLMDQSARNWKEKCSLIRGVSRLQLVTPSNWLKNEVEKSFLAEYPIQVLPSGIDIDAFRRCENPEYMTDVFFKYGLEELAGRYIVLSVASTWDKRKGLADLVELAGRLGEKYAIVLVGLNKEQKDQLPEGMYGTLRTRSLPELCALYTAADLYITLSHEETMGMTLIEAMACGTQVLCYDATALPESVTPYVGSIVPLGNVEAAAEQVRQLCHAPKSPEACRTHAMRYDKHIRFAEYVHLYESISP